MLKPGDVVGADFEVLQRLGGGGMGAVYLVHQRSTDAVRALKVMHPHWLEHPELVQRFEQEARACGRIESEHVVEILAYGVDAARQLPWLVMEYLPGETLQQRVQRLGAPDPRAALDLLEQFFHGLAAAHRAGIVHRDLKPQNVYVARPQRAGAAFTLKLLDFGIAKVLGGPRAATQAMGTRAWMAPEQELSGVVISPAADLWAVGLIVFWLLSARHFWLSIDAADSALSYEIFFQSIPLASTRLRQLDVDLSLGPAFDTWLEGCLQRDPTLRYQCVDACWNDLRLILATADVCPRTAPLPRSTPWAREAGTTRARSQPTTSAGAAWPAAAPSSRHSARLARRCSVEPPADARHQWLAPESSPLANNAEHENSTTMPFITACSREPLGHRSGGIWPALVTAAIVSSAIAVIAMQRPGWSGSGLRQPSGAHSDPAPHSGPAFVSVPAVLFVPSSLPQRAPIFCALIASAPPAAAASAPIRFDRDGKVCAWSEQAVLGYECAVLPGLWCRAP